MLVYELQEIILQKHQNIGVFKFMSSNEIILFSIILNQVVKFFLIDNKNENSPWQGKLLQLMIPLMCGEIKNLSATQVVAHNHL